MTTNLTDAVLDLAVQTQALQIECSLARLHARAALSGAGPGPYRLPVDYQERANPVPVPIRHDHYRTPHEQTISRA